ncbi:A/G-specific adenine glycosylase [Orrella sp. JC864]|uniref:A/G-specific adenine glycosylase n=1 Tax=Orrella sp. JC864 TaxID=3120298 RepID=UPI0030086D83
MDFAHRIIAWQAAHGRHGLPWQGTRDPYRIWLSEIMLQQTQVATVIPYYHRFLERFPDMAALAAASQEEVMPYWAGLGYYARARNLHRCAQAVMRHWQGSFPREPQDIASLPGIGRSTAAAISAFAHDTRAAILDGNVKRVLARHFGIEGDPMRRETERLLWTLAEDLLPGTGARDAAMPAYTQGMMDLGATVCTRGKPACQRCPLADGCLARRDGRQAELPTPKARKAVPERETQMLMLEHDGRLLMRRRPATGIWGGLWSLPEFAGDAQAAARELGADLVQAQALAPFAHVFTHFRLHIRPWHARAAHLALAEPSDEHAWVQIGQLKELALPAPVQKLLDGYYGTAAQASLIPPR